MEIRQGVFGIEIGRVRMWTGEYAEFDDCA